MIKRWFFRLLKIGLTLMLVAGIALTVVVMRARAELPSFSELKSSPNGQMIRVRAADGTLIQSLGPSFGRWVDYNDIPPVMRDAMIAVEDRRFDDHFGVDPIGVARSLQVRYERGRWAQGGSTITQQLARNIFLNNSRTFGRKVREMVLALAMETKFSKEQILELYLNKVYFGGGAYGIDSASRRFFDHGATELNLTEASIIAGLVKAPSRYAPTADAQAAIDRADVVLSLMVETGKISASQAADIDPEAVRLAPEPRASNASYFTDWALPQLDELIDETEAPIDVYTTINIGMQAQAVRSLRANAPRGAQGALVAMDDDGAVRALVGGLDYNTSNYNRAVTSVRQPGSAWKLFVYLAALESGYHPDDIVTDEPVQIGNWVPRNSGGSYAGDIPLRLAFAYSKNTVAAAIGNELGYGTIASMARRLGIRTPISTSPAMVLGSSETRLIEMTRAFAIVSAEGQDVEPFGISKVETVDGKVLYERPEEPREALIDQTVAAGMTDLLVSAVQMGTGRAAQIGRPAAGKTGTTNSNKDGWFLGFSSGLTTGVWYGRDDAKPIPQLQGGRAPARAFAMFMKAAVADRPVEEFVTVMERPDWSVDPNDDFEFEEVDTMESLVDENGNPIEQESTPSDPEPGKQPEPGSDSWIENILGRDPRTTPPDRRSPPTKAPDKAPEKAPAKAPAKADDREGG